MSQRLGGQVTGLNSGWVYREQVDRDSAGLTVLAYYTRTYRHSRESEWSMRIAAQQIWLDDQPATCEMVLQPGQQLAYHRPPWQEPGRPAGL